MDELSDDLKSIPGVGDAAIETLKAGNSLVTFPEGTRSKDGRLADFKKG